MLSDMSILYNLKLLCISNNKNLLDYYLDEHLSKLNINRLGKLDAINDELLIDIDLILIDLELEIETQNIVSTIKDIRAELPLLFFVNKNELQKAVETIQESCIYFVIRESRDKEHFRKSILKASKQAQNIRILEDKIELLNQYKNAVDMTSIVSKSDPSGVITYVNDRFCEISGYEVEELVGRPHNIIRHPSTPKETFKELWEHLNSNKIWSGTIRNLKKNREDYYVVSTIIPITNSRGEITEHISIRHDITELKKAIQRAEAAKRAKEEFLANMSHEIRTPLNAILGFVDLLQEKIVDEEQKEYIKIVHKSGEALLKTINDILDFAKIEKGMLSVEMRTFASFEEINHIYALFSQNAKDKDINLNILIDNKMPKYLVSDIFRIKQIVSNILSNSIKFTPKGKNVLLESWYEESISRLYFRVSDEGIGIPKEKIETIFQPFEQSDSSVTRKYGGTGLGLAISKQLANILDGDINVKSKEGSGSVFEFYIKAIIGESNKIEPKKEGSKRDFSGIKILIAEDNEANCAYLKILFEREGIVCKFAQDGLEAIKAFNEEQFHLILMDENMPRLNGIKAAQEIIKIEKKNSLKHTPIVALTALSLKGDRDRFLASGMDEYISKPIKKELLFEVIDKFISLNNNTEKKPFNYTNRATAMNSRAKLTLEDIAKSLDMNLEESQIVVNVFKKSINETLELLDSAISASNYEEMSKHFHKIAGSMSHIMGLDEINKDAKYCEKESLKKSSINYSDFVKKIRDSISTLP